MQRMADDEELKWEQIAQKLEHAEELHSEC